MGGLKEVNVDFHEIYSSLPWCCLGNFNDILRQCEKRGRVPQLDWLLSGFHEAMEMCGFRVIRFLP